MMGDLYFTKTKKGLSAYPYFNKVLTMKLSINNYIWLLKPNKMKTQTNLFANATTKTATPKKAEKKILPAHDLNDKVSRYADLKHQIEALLSKTLFPLWIKISLLPSTPET